MPFKCSIAHQLLLKFTKSLTVFEQHCPQYDLNVLVHWLSFFEHHCFQYTDSSFNHLLLPPADLNTACFSSQGPLYCPQVVKFSRSVKKCWCHSCQGFCKLDRYSSCLTIFLFWNQLSYFKDHVYWKSSLLKWNQRCPFLKRPFENQAFFFFKDPTHIIRNIRSFDCHVFWKQKLTRCKTNGFFFHGSLYPF